MTTYPEMHTYAFRELLHNNIAILEVCLHHTNADQHTRVTGAAHELKTLLTVHALHPQIKQQTGYLLDQIIYWLDYAHAQQMHTLLPALEQLYGCYTNSWLADTIPPDSKVPYTWLQQQAAALQQTHTWLTGVWERHRFELPQAIALQPLLTITQAAPQQHVTWHQLKYAGLFAAELEQQLRLDRVTETTDLIHVLADLQCNTRPFSNWLIAYNRQLLQEDGLPADKKEYLITLQQKLTGLTGLPLCLPAGMLADPLQPALNYSLSPVIQLLLQEREPGKKIAGRDTLLIRAYSTKEWAAILKALITIAGVGKQQPLKQTFGILCPVFSFPGSETLKIDTMASYVQGKHANPAIYDTVIDCFMRCADLVREEKKAYLREKEEAQKRLRRQ